MANRPQAAKQSALDGLCGLYALANFLRSKKADFWVKDQAETDRHVYRLLMEAAEASGLLTAHHLAEGLEWWKLRRIFNRLSADLCLSYVAVPLEQVEAQTFASTVSRVLEGEGAIVASVDRDKHWVLIWGERGRSYLIDDPDPTCKRTKIPKGAKFSMEGLALVEKHTVFAER